MQKRIFNTTGLCFPDKHYMVDALRGIGSQILELIHNEQYFVIHAPRQTGKTTLLHSLARKINNEGKYTAIVCSLERAGYRSITNEEANRVMISAVHIHAMNFLQKEEMPPKTEEFAGKDLFDYLSAWSRLQKKPIGAGQI
jgi:AAA+ ATPase superfamily predicted ATPase